jgi:hypothetical protein
MKFGFETKDLVSVPVPWTVPIPWTISVGWVRDWHRNHWRHDNPPRIITASVPSPSAVPSVISCVVISTPVISAPVAASQSGIETRHSEDSQDDQKFCLHAGISDECNGSPIHAKGGLDLRIALSRKTVQDSELSDEDLIGLRHDVDRHEDAVNKDTRQIYLLKAEIQELKESIRQLIDAVEDLSIAKQVPIITEIQEKALKRFERLIEGLKQRFKTSE